MNGVNSWDSNESTNQPQFLYRFALTGTIQDYRYVIGCLRWASVKRGNSNWDGMVLCYPDGDPITLADKNQSSWISVSASGTYMTQ